MAQRAEFDNFGARHGLLPDTIIQLSTTSTILATRVVLYENANSKSARTVARSASSPKSAATLSSAADTVHPGLERDRLPCPPHAASAARLAASENVRSRPGQPPGDFVASSSRRRDADGARWFQQCQQPHSAPVPESPFIGFPALRRGRRRHPSGPQRPQVVRRPSSCSRRKAKGRRSRCRACRQGERDRDPGDSDRSMTTDAATGLSGSGLSIEIKTRNILILNHF